MYHSFISCTHGKEKTSKNFTIWFWEIYSLSACLPLLAEEVPPLLVNSSFGCFCYPMIFLLWCVPPFSVKIPIALQSQSWVGPCWAKCFMETCLKQLRKRGEETVVQKKSVVGLWLESRPIFWTNNVSMGGCWICLLLPCPPPVSIDYLVQLHRAEKKQSKRFIHVVSKSQAG